MSVCVSVAIAVSGLISLGAVCSRLPAGQTEMDGARVRVRRGAAVELQGVCLAISIGGQHR